MLKIINNLSPFFEDGYRRIHVREYAKIMKISPPTASTLLMSYYKEGLLNKTSERNYLLFNADSKSKEFIELSRIYWRNRLSELIDLIEKNSISPIIILFGSLSKAEAKSESDIDIVIIGLKKELNLSQFEKKLKRNIQLFWFSSIKDIKNKDLQNNILNGYVLTGRLSL